MDSFPSREKIMHDVSVRRFVSAALVVVGGLCVSANAQEVLVSMGTNTSFRGITVNPNPDARGNTWNSLTPGPSAAGLLSTTGATTAIGIVWTTPVGTDSYNGPYGNGTSGVLATRETQANTVTYAATLGDLDTKTAGFSFAAGDGTGTTGVGPNPFATQFLLEGLNPLETYSLTFFGSHIYDTLTTTYSVYTDPGYAIGFEGSASLNTEFTDPVSGGQDPNLSNVVTISGLVPTAGGFLYIEFAGDTAGPAPSSDSGVGYLNSFELLGTAVPEPASLGLGALGCLLMFARRSRA
jgi:hypothetical protein